jgi:hypothetical protein
MTSNGKTPNTKGVDLRELRNFVVDKFLIWIHLVPKKTDLHSVLYSMSRIKTAYGCIWVCGVVVEEALREVEVTGSNHAAAERRDFTRKNAQVGGWLVGSLLYKKVFFLFIFGF